jgi:hypothetical protein
MRFFATVCRRGTVALIASLALAGCGGSGADLGTAAPSLSAAPQTGRAAAEREAARLLALVTPPPDAAPISEAPSGLTEPATKPNVDSLVDQARVWRLAMSFDEASAWISVQRPGGMTSSGNATASDHGTLVLNSRQFDAPAGPSWDSSQLQLAVAADGPDRSFLRADGLVVWVTADPVRDERDGKRVHVSAGRPCPASDRDVIGVTNAGQPDLDAALVPEGAPTGGLVCRYVGLNGKRWTLQADQKLTAATAARIADAARRVRLAHAIGGAHGCPADDASATLIVLSYAGRDVNLWLKRAGCAWIANGHISAAAGDFDAALPKATR